MQPTRFNNIYKGLHEKFMKGFEDPETIKYDFIELGLKTRSENGFVKSAAFYDKEKIKAYYDRPEFKDETCPDLQPTKVYKLV